MGCRQALASSLAWADRAHFRSAPKLPALKVALSQLAATVLPSQHINLHHEISNATKGRSDVALATKKIFNTRKILVHGASRPGTKANQSSCPLYHSIVYCADSILITLRPTSTRSSPGPSQRSFLWRPSLISFLTGSGSS